MTDELVVVPGTPDRLDDVVTILGGNPEACLCQYWRLSSGDFNRARGPRRVRLLRAQLGEEPPAGMIAYLAGEPVGWCGFGVRQRVQRLVRSRTIPAIDDRPVWSIYCFTVRTGHRRKGIARALLAGLIEYAREMGAPALEAYPVETAGLRIHGTAAYVGVASMFVEGGFVRVVETGARSDHLPRTLMRLEMSDSRH